MRNSQDSRIENALRTLETGIVDPRALNIQPAQEMRLRRAIERVGAQLAGAGEPVLTVALAGCTGSGKSTLINALAGAPIAGVSEHRPCTTGINVYHHEAVPGEELFKELAETAEFVPHARPELRFKVIVDTPDLDSFATGNRKITRALLKTAGLVIYIFSPERYLEERAWSVIREEKRFSRSLAVLNKSDTVSPDVLEKISGDIRDRFFEMGLPDVRLLRLSAASNTPGMIDAPAAGSTKEPIDEFASLRAFLEFELRSGEVFQMLRRQRINVVEVLREKVAEVVRPGEIRTAIERLSAAVEDHGEKAADELAGILKNRISAITSQLEPLIIIRKHQRFWGPFRVWLAVSDFLSYRLPQLVRGIRFAGTRGEGSIVEKALRLDYSDRVDDLLSAGALELQNVCYEENLPLERWRTITEKDSGSALLLTIANDVEAKFEGISEDASTGGAVAAWLISLIAFLFPVGLAVFGTYILVGDILNARFSGFGVLQTFIVLTLLGYLHLHVLTALFFRSGRPASSRRIGESVLRKTVKDIFKRWLASYRADIDADIRRFEEPLKVLAEQAAEIPAVGDPARSETSHSDLSEPVEKAATGQSGEVIPPAESLKRTVEQMESE